MAGAKNKSNDALDSQMKKQEYYDNRVAFYSNWVGAWIENRMEVDKQLLTLSALAIGLLVGVFGKPSNIYESIIWLISGLSFFICIALILIIFIKNTNYIDILLKVHHAGDNGDDIIHQKEENKKSQSLKKITIIMFLFFGVGALFTIILAIMRSGIWKIIGDCFNG